MKPMISETRARDCLEAAPNLDGEPRRLLLEAGLRQAKVNQSYCGKRHEHIETQLSEAVEALESANDLVDAIEAALAGDDADEAEQQERGSQ